jgi:hypothetical protein
MHYVVTKKFARPVGISKTVQAEPFDMHVFPNPASAACNVTFTLDQPGPLRLTLVSPLGQPVATWLDRNFEKGPHWFRFNTASLAPGIYQVILRQGNETAVSKVILIR